MTATLESEASSAPTPPPSETPQELSKRWLALGVLGRTWLWFLAGCILITLIPLLFGWHPFLIETGSMAPRINVGDVVLASPEHDAQTLLGHVTVFDDPDFPGKIKTHRVISIDPQGLLVTKGDANPTADSQHVDTAAVHGLGRLLVRFVGLPVIWLQQREFLPLLLFLLSLLGAAYAVMRDQDPEEELSDTDDPADGPDPDVNDGVTDDASTTVATQTKPATNTGIPWRNITRQLAWRLGFAAMLASLLILPTAFAAFAATTNNGTQSWTVPNWDYTTQLKALGPKIYYKLDDASPSANAVDSSGNGYTGTYNGTTTNYTYGVTGALVTDTPNLAVTQKAANACIFTPAASSEAAPGPATYSEIVWFKVANGYNQGGKLVGLENQRTTTVSTQYDRHIYMDGAGKLFFGVWLTATGVPKTINSPLSYNDGNWHMAVATMGAAGMHLYVDGAQVATDVNTTSETFAATGYWRFGCGNLSGWGAAANWTGPNAPAASQNYPLLGSIDEVSIFTKQLTAANVQFLYWIR